MESTMIGKTILFGRFNRGTGMDIMKFSLEDEKVSPLVQSPFNETGAKVSPDGRWLAYDVVSSDRSEVYVSSIEGGGRIQISVDGGVGPRWTSDGKSLFYSGPQGEALYRVEVSLNPQFRASRPEKILSHEKLGGYVEDYEVHPDGKRLAIIYNRDNQGQRAFRLMMNVPQELASLTHRSSSH
jgi:Tol biopolymer transport system component